MFNANPSVHAIPIIPGHHCWVIDNALRQPERWVELACEHRAQFAETTHNAYPGPELRMPEPISAQLDDFFARHLRQHLGARRTLTMYSRLSMATTPPEHLQPRQWICHRDRLGVPPGQCVVASVLYLFHDERLGGTGFYRPKRPKADIDLLVHESGLLDGPAFAAKYAIERGYLCTSNAWFEKVCAIPPRWNRLICYDGGLFHSSDIAAPQLLSSDPARGRLTLNGFFTCRKALPG